MGFNLSTMTTLKQQLKPGDTKIYVNDLSNMFRGCLALTDIRFGKDFTVAEATKLSDMFSGCAQITNLDLTYFNTRYVQYMDGMFEDCKNVTLNLYNWKVSPNSSCISMLAGCNQNKITYWKL